MLVRVLGGYLPELTQYPNFGVHVSAGDFENYRVQWKRSFEVSDVVHVR
jgi:hypothetical protein